MKLEKNYTIENQIVEEEFKNGDIAIYARREGNDLIYLYFVNTKSEKVLFLQTIEVGCNQNYGYISDMSFQEVK